MAVCIAIAVFSWSICPVRAGQASVSGAHCGLKAGKSQAPQGLFLVLFSDGLPIFWRMPERAMLAR